MMRPGLAARQFRIGIALLRHDGRAGGEGIRQLDEAEGGRGPDHHFLGEAREVHGADGGGGQRLQHEVAVGDGIQRIGGGPVEAQRLRRGFPVDGEGGAGQRRRAERGFVQPRAGIPQAAAIPREHLHIGHEVMAERDRLRGLEVG